MLYLYLLKNPRRGFDVYKEAVIAARSEEEARLIHPNGQDRWLGKTWKLGWADESWNDPNKLDATIIGVAGEDVEEGVVISSFNAG